MAAGEERVDSARSSPYPHAPRIAGSRVPPSGEIPPGKTIRFKPGKALRNMS